MTCYELVLYNISLTLQGMKTDKAWRAMLIKDSEGDWGFLKGSWTGVKAGIPGEPGEKHFCVNVFQK